MDGVAFLGAPIGFGKFESVACVAVVTEMRTNLLAPLVQALPVGTRGALGSNASPNAARCGCVCFPRSTICCAPWSQTTPRPPFADDTIRNIMRKLLGLSVKSPKMTDNPKTGPAYQEAC